MHRNAAQDSSAPVSERAALWISESSKDNIGWERLIRGAHPIFLALQKTSMEDGSKMASIREASGKYQALLLECDAFFRDSSLFREQFAQTAVMASSFCLEAASLFQLVDFLYLNNNDSMPSPMDMDMVPDPSLITALVLWHDLHYFAPQTEWEMAEEYITKYNKSLIEIEYASFNHHSSSSYASSSFSSIWDLVAYTVATGSFNRACFLLEAAVDVLGATEMVRVIQNYPPPPPPSSSGLGRHRPMTHGQQLTGWQSQVAGIVLGSDSPLRTIQSIMMGNEASIAGVAGKCGDPWCALLATALFVSSSSSSSSSSWQQLLAAAPNLPHLPRLLLSGEMAQFAAVVLKLRHSWLGAHLLDLCAHAGLLPAFPLSHWECDVREVALLTYSQWLWEGDHSWLEVAVDVGLCCPQHGAGLLERMLLHLPRHQLSRVTLLKLQQRLLQLGQMELGRELCVGSAAHALAEDCPSEALFWASRTGDAVLIERILSTVLNDAFLSSNFDALLSLTDALPEWLCETVPAARTFQRMAQLRVLVLSEEKNGAIWPCLCALVSDVNGAPQKYWYSLLLNVLPLLEKDQPVGALLSREETYALLTAVNTLSVANATPTGRKSGGSGNDKDMDKDNDNAHHMDVNENAKEQQDNFEKNLDLLRLLLMRHFTRLLLPPPQ